MDILALVSYEPLCFSRNPVEQNIDAMNPLLSSRVGIRYYLEVWTPSYFQANTFEKLIELIASEEPPSSVGSTTVFPGATFSIEDLLDGMLTLKRPEFGQQKVSVCDGLTRPFYTKWRRELDGTIETGMLPSGWVIKAGINERYFEEWKDLFWTKYIGEERRFLTFQPTQKTINPDQPEYLYFLTNFSPVPTELRLRIQVHYENGTSTQKESVFITGITPYTVYCFPVGPQALKLNEDPNNIVSYKVWVSNQLNERLSEVRTYKLNTRYTRNVKYLIYNNALGGYDTIMFTGQSSSAMAVERQLFERQTNFNHAPTYAERVVNHVTGERQLTINTGYMKKELGFLACENLLFARDILLVTDREYLPLINTTSTLEYPADDENMLGREMTFSYANRERNVSPVPIAPPVQQRPTGWRPYTYGGCSLDVNGIRTGKQSVAMLEKYYLDNNLAVKPSMVKPNTPDTDGYLPPQITNSCRVESTPFFSDEINRLGSFVRNNCPAGQSGNKAMVMIPANMYGSELSKADANAKAEAAWVRLNTQDYANSVAICSIAPELYVVPNVPSGRFNYRWYDVDGRTSNAMIQGGPGTEIADGPAYGNSWPIAGNTNPNSVIYPQNSNDITLPIDPEFAEYTIFIYGWNKSKSVKVYYNGILKINKIITQAEFQAVEGSYKVKLSIAMGLSPIPNMAMVYCSIAEI